MIVEQYVHTLIPNDPQFSPTSEQIVRFFDRLLALGASPENSNLFVLKPSGRLRAFTDPLTGEKKSFPGKDRVPLKSTAEIAATIGELQEYYVALDGEGPPRLPPFALYAENSPFTGNYAYSVACCVRPEPVSMSDPGDEQTDSDIPDFGEACRVGARTAVFRHPLTSELIEVANASCARFWVEFEFGKWLLPKIGSSLEILDPVIVQVAAESFAVSLAQGFHHF